MCEELDRLRGFFAAVEVAYYQTQPWDNENPQWCEGVKTQLPESATECSGDLTSFNYRQVA